MNKLMNFLSFRLLAKGIISLLPLITSGFLNYQVELTDPDNNKLEDVLYIPLYNIFYLDYLIILSMLIFLV
jgi:hypothetical protein